MKFCYACGKTTTGKPLFCNFCGRSYDQKLCPRLHPNPRKAEACSRCGNRNLSMPQPRVPRLWRLLASGIFAMSGLVLFETLLGVISGVAAYVIQGQPLPGSLEWRLFGIAVLWGSWILLFPHLLRVVIRYLLTLRRNPSRLSR